jgi:phosphotransferase system enzyme I (PtsI)
MIADQGLRDEIITRIRSQKVTAEYALVMVLRGYYKRFEQMESEYISERAHDLADIEKKLSRILLGKKALERPRQADCRHHRRSQPDARGSRRH